MHGSDDDDDDDITARLSSPTALSMMQFVDLVGQEAGSAVTYRGQYTVEPAPWDDDVL